MHTLYGLAWRNLKTHRLRTAFSALAVASGSAVVIAADVVSRTILGIAREGFTALAARIMGFGLTAVGGVILSAAGFLVFNAFAMTLTRRQREIGALRALGMVRRQVTRLVLVEALVTGGLGVALGLLGGPLLGRGLVRWVQAQAGDFMPDPIALRSPASGSILLAAGLGLGVTLFSALFPAWRASRVPPLVALRRGSGAAGQEMEGTGIGRWGAPIGLVTVIGMTGYLAVAPPGEWVMPPWDVRLTVLFVLLWLGGLALALPALVGGVGRLGRGPMARQWGVTGYLLADNVTRARRRVTLTVATLSVGLAMIVGVSGIITFVIDGVMAASWGPEMRRTWVLSPFDFAYREPPATLEPLQLPPELVVAVKERWGSRAEIASVYQVSDVPETGLLPYLGTAVIETADLRRFGEAVFTFYEGDWETAWPHLESPCGLFLPPLVARRNDVWLGDPLTIHAPQGPVNCSVAGIGSNVFFGVPIIGTTDPARFGVETPLMLFLRPRPGVDGSRLGAELETLADRYAGAWLFTGQQALDETQGQFDILKLILSGFLLLAVLTAALGVVNTTVMSVVERRRELGLLRAVGATRRQVRAMVVGEAALMGLVGSGLGLVAGLGITVILTVVAGGNAFGVRLSPWASAWTAVRPALLNGLLGLVAAPLVSAGAAWLPVRPLLARAVVETLREAKL